MRLIINIPPVFLMAIFTKERFITLGHNHFSSFHITVLTTPLRIKQELIFVLPIFVTFVV